MDPSLTLDPADERAPAGPLRWLTHLRANLVLGLPLVGSQLGGMLMNTTDTVMLGWYDVTELAAGSIATQFLFTVMMFGAGLSYAVIPLAAGAEARGDVRQVRRNVRMGLWVCTAYGLLVMPLLWKTSDLFLWLGQDPAVAELSGTYMRIAQWSIFPLLLWWALRGFMTVVERTGFVLAMTAIAIIINAGLNAVLIFGLAGFPEMGIRGAAFATVFSQSFIMVALMILIAVSPRTRHYQVFVRFWRPDVDALGAFIRLGLPIGATVTAETGLFIFSSIFMGWLGVVALAAHGIVLQIASLAFMVPMGLAQAATARVGLYHGREDAVNVNRAAYSMLATCIVYAAFSAVLFFAVPGTLVGLFLDEGDPRAAEVALYAVPLMFAAACFQLVDNAQAIAAANLRGLHDTRIPMVMAIASYWVIGIPLSYLAGFTFGFGGVGVWAGLAGGLAVAAVLLNWRFAVISPSR